jgi:hypothetical protein
VGSRNLAPKPLMPHCLPAEQALTDPTLSAFDLPLRRRFFPLGFPLELETNSTDVIEAADEAWGRFSQAFDAAPVRVALGVTDSDTMPANLQSTFRSREHLMSVLADSENFFTCDFSRGFAFGWITRVVAADHPLLRYRFLTAAANMLIEQLALAPLHGALVVRNNSGILLCGESFAGKSTLAYACARSGWTYLSDDGTFLLRARTDRYAIGDPHTIRFREDARSLFPELADRLPTVRPNGKIAIELFTTELPIQTVAGCVIDHVVFLNRQQQCPPTLLRYPKEEALAAWEAFACYGAEPVRRAQKHCYRRLLGAGIWELAYSHFDDAVVHLDQLVELGG